MYRLRFETIEQVFDIPDDVQVVLPLDELAKHISSGNFSKISKNHTIFAEIPAVLWEHSIESTKRKLELIKAASVENVLCENIGSFFMCKEMGFRTHCGMLLNVINSSAIEQYSLLGGESITLSFEMPFNKMRAMLKNISKDGLGIIVYGYLPLMKFRACPAMGKNGCRDCNRNNYLKDRTGANFRIMCRKSEYSELLNSVPLYAADKSLPDLDFYTLYYTVESRDECLRIFDMVQKRQSPDFSRTAGLYGRELL